MRLRHCAPLCVLLTACHRSTEIRGIYVSQQFDQVVGGTLFPCTEANQAVLVPDSALAARYFAAVSAPGKAAYVELRGFNTKSGSIYQGRRYFIVQEIIAVRPRAEGECPAVAHPVSAVVGH